MDIDSNNDSYVSFKYVKSNKRMLLGNISLFAAILIITTACFHMYSWYSIMAPYGTLIAAVFLIITFFCYVDIKDALKDKYFYMMAVADILALIHLLVLRSNMGAILTVADFLLVLYLSDKITLSKPEVIISAIYIGIFFLYWTIDVKGYFKGYNTNYGGLVLLSGFVFLIYAYELIMKEYGAKLLDACDKSAKKNKAIYIFLRLVELFLFAMAYNIIAWYRSRCALMGLVFFTLLFVIPRKVWKNKVFYWVVTLGGTVGAVLFSLLYVWLGNMKDVFTVRLFYKDILSGREEIWKELWGEFIKKPITGIGSSYEIKLDWMGGIFEVHSGLLDILIVHGTVVFLVTIILLIRNLLALHEKVSDNYMCKVAACGIFGMLAAAFIENYIIVAPFSLMLLVLFSYVNSRNSGTGGRFFGPC